MGRLKTMPSRLGRMEPKVRAAPKVAEPFYQSSAWAALRRLKQSEGRTWCVDCGSTRNLMLDHIHERKDGGADLDPANVEWRCKPCHNRKTAQARARRARGET